MQADLQERFRRAVPEPDMPLDVDELYRRGRRRRTRRIAAAAAAVIVLVAGAALAGTQLIGQQSAPLIGDGGHPNPHRSPALALSGTEIDAWTVQAHETDQGWCVRALYATDLSPNPMNDPDQQPCTDIDRVDGPVDALGVAEGADGHIAWGTTTPNVARVVASWPDGRERQVVSANSDAVPFGLWAVTYPDIPPESVAAFDDGGQPLGRETWSELTAISDTPPFDASGCSDGEIGGVVDHIDYEAGDLDPIAIVEDFYDRPVEPSDRIRFDQDAGLATVVRDGRTVAAATLQRADDGGWLLDRWQACSDFDPFNAHTDDPEAHDDGNG